MEYNDEGNAMFNEYVEAIKGIVLKKGVVETDTGVYKDVIFVNAKAGGASNDVKGMGAISKVLAPVTGHQVYIARHGYVPTTDVLDDLKEGKILAYHFHKKGYKKPIWKIALGYISEIAIANAGYASGKATKTKAKTKAKSAPKKVALLS